MSKTAAKLSPAQELAQRMIQRLVKESLMIKDATGSIQGKIADGRMTQADWKLLFEKSAGLHKQP